ncbi:hypothetical protein [Tautonia marina]|uniref:hypothetical protein n=1 Tax=Tautonia marina TaxID=2653855 RepID=UPI001260A3BB|nr:hypothetical protein [Tautonia marina]
MTSTIRAYDEREISRATECNAVKDLAARFGIPVQLMRDILAAQHLEALFKYLGGTETGYRTASVQNQVTEFMVAIDRLTQGSVNTTRPDPPESKRPGSNPPRRRPGIPIIGDEPCRRIGG